MLTKAINYTRLVKEKHRPLKFNFLVSISLFFALKDIFNSLPMLMEELASNFSINIRTFKSVVKDVYQSLEKKWASRLCFQHRKLLYFQLYFFWLFLWFSFIFKHIHQIVAVDLFQEQKRQMGRYVQKKHALAFMTMSMSTSNFVFVSFKYDPCQILFWNIIWQKLISSVCFLLMTSYIRKQF